MPKTMTLEKPVTSQKKILLDPEQFFNLLSDQTRLRCLNLIHHEAELCVCELTYALNMVQPKISRHLALLRKFNLVTDRRKGLWIYYRLHPDLPEWIQAVIHKTFTSIRPVKPFAADLIRLTKMPDRPAACSVIISSHQEKTSCCPKKT